ncbi:MAG: hypothetical protein LC102_10985 [Ignavibacteriales bacterium]|jgi:hypothetical protein|nr:MAG: hypothetical protein F9K26_05770 [Ignavibacteriaceae bacterium]MBW7873715.1 hypothetical protein [Ignavibacteria bacterium]MCZ2143940.1 hypothetical protein [Ignavibacteriales bacterium]OQY69916.1 MAG: hypothetical protein B6D45_12085 [Ignavibacteriales bacterium UTCHB3]MBZ0197569.1 hypothetical protein [Ignavibacteriaceae bacterium]
MKETFSVVKGIRFPRYSLKVVQYLDKTFGVIESFYFFKFCYKRVILKFDRADTALEKYDELHASRKFDFMTR